MWDATIGNSGRRPQSRYDPTDLKCVNTGRSVHTLGVGGRTLRLSLVEQVSMRESSLFTELMRVNKVSRVPGCKAPAKRRARSRSVQLQNSSTYWILEACHIYRRGALVPGSFSCRRSCQCDLSWRAPSSWKWYASWLIGFGSAAVVAW